MKTAIEQLIDGLKKDEINSQYAMERVSIRNCIIFASSLLETEKQQIKRAFNIGGTEAYEQSSEDYYNSTFNNQ